MRLLEIVLILSFVPALLLPFVPPLRRPRWLYGLTLLPALLTPVQLLLEGYRWQLLPAYVLAVMIALLRLPAVRRPSPTVNRRWLGVAGSVGSLLVVIVAGGLAALFPIFRLNDPGGDYAIGTTARYLRDENRDRELMVQVWYPAAANPQTPRASYLPQSDTLAPALLAGMGLPSFLFDHLRYVQTHAFDDAPAAAPIGGEGFPVLLFSHGMGGYRHQNVVQMEALAAHGYTVVSIDHTDYAGAVLFPDGTIKPFTQGEAVALENREVTEAGMRQTWMDDQQFVLAQLTTLNTADPLLTGAFDLSRVGMFGHSFGGSTITFVCEATPACQGSINLDGSMPLADDQAAWQKPFWYWFSDQAASPQPPATDEQLAAMGTTREAYTAILEGIVADYQQAYALRGEQGMWLHVQGMQHQGFSDTRLVSPLFALIGMTGTLDPMRAGDLMNAYLLAFFDTFVKGEPASPLIAGASPDYPEVTVMTADDVPRLPATTADAG